MNEAYLALAFHLHQPVGNFENVIERAHQNCYLPFVNILSEFPDLKVSLHISGCLFDYFEAKHPEFLEKLKGMVACGQVEFLGGGYYEPILIAIPEADALGQIAIMSDYLKIRFGKNPSGMWIPERVWQPELAGLIPKAKIKFSILDDAHFLKSGLKKEELYSYFLSKWGDEKLAVFPSDKTLRYSIPFGQINEVINYFAQVSAKYNKPLFTYGDDAEKFGEWPGTYKWVYEEKWLLNFLNELRKNNLWLKTMHFSEYLDFNPPRGEVKIPQGSYEEMLEWAGGSWMNFLKKYPETDQMHKRMCYVSEKISGILPKTKSGAKKLEMARRFLYRGQCNCGFWHGVFGGLYLYHLRAAIYGNLIQAEKIADEILRKKEKKWRKAKIFDFDGDGKDEAVLENREFFLYFDPQDGGVLKEFDFKPFNINLINTLARRKEHYHDKILARLKEHQTSGVMPVYTIHDDVRKVDAQIGKKLIYDRFTRYCLRDHFLSQKTKRGAFMDNSYKELGNFAGGVYQADKKKNILSLKSSGFIANAHMDLTKEISLKSQGFEVTYTLKCKIMPTQDFLFAVEFNFTLPFLNSDRYKYFSDRQKIAGLEEEGAIGGVSSFGVFDMRGGLGLNLNFSPGLYELWYFPVKTVSQSERAYEENFQCSCILALWQVDIHLSNHNYKISLFLGDKSKKTLDKKFIFC